MAANAQAAAAGNTAAPTVQQVRNAIIASAVRVVLNHDSGVQQFNNVSNSSPLQVSIRPRYVGLVTRFTLRVQMQITTPAGCVMTRTGLGAANLLAQLTMLDLNQIQRHQTSGRHLHMVNSARRQRRSNSAFLSDTPSGWGTQWGGQIENCPITIAAGTTTNLVMTYEIPVSYTDEDFRGAVYMNTTNAQLTLSAIINTLGAFVQSGADTLNAVYSYVGGSAPAINGVTVDGSQYFWDQLPVVKGPSGNQVLIPLTDMSTTYNLNEQPFNSGFQAGSDYGIPYGDLRSYLSTVLTFDNGGQFNTGSDINYMQLQTAGMYTYWKKSPWAIAKETRDEFHMDTPPGVYYFGSRKHPITATEFGNTRLFINASQVNANSLFMVGLEFFATGNTIAGSAISAN